MCFSHDQPGAYHHPKNTHTHATNTHTRAHSYVHTYAHTHTRTHTLAHTHTLTHTHAHTIHTCSHARHMQMSSRGAFLNTPLTATPRRLTSWFRPIWDPTSSAFTKTMTPSPWASASLPRTSMGFQVRAKLEVWQVCVRVCVYRVLYCVCVCLRVCAGISLPACLSFARSLYV